MKFKSLILGVSAGLLLAGVSTTFGQTTNYLTLIDPSFETPTVASGGYTSDLTGTGWAWHSFNNGGIGAIINPSTPYNLQDGSNVGQIFGYGGATGLFVQTTSYSFIGGDTYVFSLDVNNPSGDPINLAIDVGGVSIQATSPIATTGSTNLVPFSVSYTATGTEAGPVEVGLYGTVNGYDGVQFDSASLAQITPAPEPGTLTLAAMGGIGMLTLIRRRKN